MKKLLFMVAMVVAGALSASAQREAGSITLQPKIGFGLTNITKLDGPSLPIGDGTLDKKLNVGGMVGVEVEYQLAPRFSLAAGVNYSLQGAALKDYKLTTPVGWMEIKDMGVELQYVNIPVVLNAYLFEGFAVKAGVQVGFLTSATEKYEFDTNITATGAAAALMPDPGKYESKNYKDECKKVDFSIPMGVSYEFSNVVIDARYHLGLTKINKEGDKSMKNSVFMLTFGYKFDI